LDILEENNVSNKTIQVRTLNSVTNMRYNARKFLFLHVTLAHLMEARVTSNIWGKSDLCYSCHSVL